MRLRATFNKQFFFNNSNPSCFFALEGMVLSFDLMEAARGQKHPSEAKNGMKESIYAKKCLMKVA